MLAFDPSQLSETDGLPQNGHDYIKMVQEERAKCPEICTAPPPPPPSVLESTSPVHSQVIKNFTSLREQIEQLRTTIKVPDHKNLNEIQLSEKQKEDYKERSGRRAKSLIKSMELGVSPQARKIIKLNQLEIHLTLERLAELCEIEPSYATIHADWIFSLMATLRTPIDADICSTLRRLAKVCVTTCGHKSSLSARERASSLLILLIVRLYFGQLDINLK